MDEAAIDIVIPSFRMDEQSLLKIISLKQPVSFNFQVFIICDNPIAKIPESIRQLNHSGQITLIVNESNLGPSASRNKGFLAGKAKWILLLDDDIDPDENLLQAYANAIGAHPDAIGFAGPCFFPQPFNAATLALKINGSTDHFSAASHTPSQYWVPTANVMLNRYKMDEQLFDTNLRTGEDIDFLVRNALKFGEKYISVPTATVHHPWWNNGAVQTKRQFQYGIGASQVAAKAPVSNYAYRDFTNSSESLLLWVLFFPLAFIPGWLLPYLLFPIVLLFAEWFTNWLKAIWIGRTASPIVASLLAWTKNCREAGQLYGVLRSGSLNGFAERIDMGFQKPHPRSFRLNRWKIIKSLVLVALYLVITI
jgi:glycosyltransferase involved in cell wall biosynthesis